MAIHQIAQGTRQPAKQAHGAVAPPDQLTDFVVVFHRHETRLMEYELAELRRWVHSWYSVERPNYVVMGCCAETSREDRLRRLRGMLEQLASCGVSRDMIRYTDEWVDPPTQSVGTELPQDVVWLKVVDAARAGREVTSMRSLFQA